MNNIAFHIFGMLRNLEGTKNSFREVFKFLSSSEKCSKFTVFISIWDSHIEYDGKLTPSGFVKNQIISPVDKLKFQEFCKESFPEFEIVLNFHKFDLQLNQIPSFLKIIFLSYQDRLQYEIDNDMYFDKIVISRSDVIFIIDEFKLKRLNSEFFKNTVDCINGSAGINHGFVYFSDPKYRRSFPQCEDFVFFGNFREMNQLMRSFTYYDEFKDYGIDSHAIIPLILKKFGFFLGDIKSTFNPRIFRSIENAGFQPFSEEEVKFTFLNCAKIEKTLARNEMIWWGM